MTDESLKAKLREIEFDRDEFDSINYSYVKLSDAQIIYVLHAVEEAGWQEPWDGATRVKSFEMNRGRVYMLGQEFYDRFCKEVTTFKIDSKNFPEQREQWPGFILNEVFKAAEKAAGLSTKDVTPKP